MATALDHIRGLVVRLSLSLEGTDYAEASLEVDLQKNQLIYRREAPSKRLYDLNINLVTSLQLCQYSNL